MEGLGDVIQWATSLLRLRPCPECLERKEFLNALFPFQPQGVRILKDGRVVFPIGGKIPELPDGYERTNNPYVLKPTTPTCKHRQEVTTPTTCCGGSKKRLVCHKYQERTDALNCINCQQHGGHHD